MRSFFPCLLTFIALFSSGVFAAPVNIDRLLASVNSALVLQSDIVRFRQTLKLRSQLDPLFVGTTVANKGAAASDSEIVEFLIDEKIIAQAFPVTDSEVEQEINSIQSNNRIDRATLKGALSEQGFSFEEYFDLIRAGTSKRNLISRDIQTKVAISDDDVKNYFFNHYTRTSAVPVAYHLQLISVSIANYKSLSAAREVIQRAATAIKGGESFDDVARRMSDHATASGGGDLGTLSDDQMSAAIREQVKKLKIGDVSEVFGGSVSGGFSIIKLVDVKSGDSERYEKMKNEIRNQLAASEYQHQIALWLERMRQSSFIHRTGESQAKSLPLAPQKK